MAIALQGEYGPNFTITVDMRSIKTTYHTISKAFADIVHIINKGDKGVPFHLFQKRARGRAVWVAMVMAAFLVFESLSILDSR